MSEVIRKEYVICSEDYLASKPKDDDKRKAALRKIFCAGWLHTEIRADIDARLHRRSTVDVLTGSLADCHGSPGSSS